MKGEGVSKSGKLVYGVGINDADYAVYKYVDTKRETCPYYSVWVGMLERGYSDKLKNKHPTYKDVIVCKEWHSFTTFRVWMTQQDWAGKQLDKDILTEGNKVYSPDTCVFVDKVINTFITDSTASRGEYPIGVSWNKRRNKFIGYCKNPFTHKLEYLGYFLCPNQAHLAWKARKHELACQLADLQTDERVATALRLRYT